MQDDDTISIYDKQANAYKELLQQLAEDTALIEFSRLFTPGTLILDLGCGPGLSSATFRDLGLQVDPIDASHEMVKLANTNYAINARLAKFDDITGTSIYHGIWANFSLLHTKRQHFPVILKSLHRALIPGGYLHLGMKTGIGEERDNLGRFYTYYTEAELRHLL